LILHVTWWEKHEHIVGETLFTHRKIRMNTNYLLKHTLEYRQVYENGMHGRLLDHKTNNILMVI
jgi:hypothetical protein